MKIALLIAACGLVLATAKWAFWHGRRLPRHRVRLLRIRLRLRLHPGKGLATVAELWWRWGRLAAFRHSRRTRPSLTFTERLLAPASQYSVLAGRAHFRHGLRLPLDEHAVIYSPPRGGKTGWLARVVVHYPGPVLSTTTKHDMFELTAAARAGRGPVQVFNPQHIGGIPSTFRWNPLDGCAAPAVAIRRADAFASSVSQKGVEDASFWAAKASDYLRGYFHAAALAGLDLRHVARWVSGTGSEEAEDILYDSPAAARHMADQLAEMRGEANKTISTVRMTMSRALAFLADPALAATVLPGPGESLDIAEFLREAGTLYLIAETRGEDAPLAPLFACLASEIHFTASLAGSLLPGGRLDPPLLTRARRGDTDLPGTGSVLAGRLRGQGNTDHHRGPRRGPAARTVGRRRRPHHHGHLRSQDLPARHLRPRHPRHRLRPVRHHRHARNPLGLRPAARTPRLLHPPPRPDPRHDPPAPRPLRPDHPRRHVPGHRPPAHGLARPRLPPRPPGPAGRHRADKS